MGSTPHNLKEKDWERYVNQVLSTHHSMFGGSYQRVPDYGGDRGLEGFTSDTGEAYQSYADQDSKNNEERTRKQKKKIRDDLNKLETNSDFWEEMLQGTKLKHWTLVVPSLDDKEVVKYAKKKAQQLANKNLPFIDDGFYADVKTADDFPAAKAYLRDPSLPRLGAVDVSDQQLAEFRDSETAFIGHLRRKLQKATPSLDNARLEEHVDRWLRWHLKSANLLDGLFNSFPHLWELLDELIETTGDSIETEEALDTRRPAHRLRDTRQDFEAKLESHDFQFLTTSDRTSVSYGVVAKWLGECPLDFLGGADD